MSNELINVMDTCGDCETGRCHWGGEQSRAGVAAVKADPLSDRPCGCARHEISYRYRVQQLAEQVDTDRDDFVADRRADLDPNPSEADYDDSPRAHGEG